MLAKVRGFGATFGNTVNPAPITERSMMKKLSIVIDLNTRGLGTWSIV
jgi:hypothetical protein